MTRRFLQIFLLITACFAVGFAFAPKAEAVGSYNTQRLSETKGGQETLQKIQSNAAANEAARKQFAQKGTKAAQSLYCTMDGLIRGNMGTFAGLLISIGGLYTMLVKGAAKAGFITLIAGVMMAAMPGLIMSFIDGLNYAYSSITVNKEGATGKAAKDACSAGGGGGSSGVVTGSNSYGGSSGGGGGGSYGGSGGGGGGGATDEFGGSVGATDEFGGVAGSEPVDYLSGYRETAGSTESSTTKKPNASSGGVTTDEFGGTTSVGSAPKGSAGGSFSTGTTGAALAGSAGGLGFGGLGGLFGGSGDSSSDTDETAENGDDDIFSPGVQERTLENDKIVKKGQDRINELDHDMAELTGDGAIHISEPEAAEEWMWLNTLDKEHKDGTYDSIDIYNDKEWEKEETPGSYGIANNTPQTTDATAVDATAVDTAKTEATEPKPTTGETNTVTENAPRFPTKEDSMVRRSQANEDEVKSASNRLSNDGDPLNGTEPQSADELIWLNQINQEYHDGKLEGANSNHLIYNREPAKTSKADTNDADNAINESTPNDTQPKAQPAPDTSNQNGSDINNIMKALQAGRAQAAAERGETIEPEANEKPQSFFDKSKEHKVAAVELDNGETINSTVWVPSKSKTDETLKGPAAKSGHEKDMSTGEIIGGLALDGATTALSGGIASPAGIITDIAKSTAINQAAKTETMDSLAKSDNMPQQFSQRIEEEQDKPTPAAIMEGVANAVPGMRTTIDVIAQTDDVKAGNARAKRYNEGDTSIKAKAVGCTLWLSEKSGSSAYPIPGCSETD